MEEPRRGEGSYGFALVGDEQQSIAAAVASATHLSAKQRCSGHQWLSTPLTAAVTPGRVLFFKTPTKVDFLFNCMCTHATGSQPPEHETCAHHAAAASTNDAMKQPAQRSNGPQSTPDPTPSGTAANNSTDVSQPETTAKSAPIGTPLTPWAQKRITPLARDKQHI